MFKLCRPLTISSDCGPVIGPGDIFMDTRVDHGLNGEYMTRFHNTYSLISWVVWYVRGTVEQFAYPVAAIGSVDWKPILLDKFGNDITDLTIHSSGFADSNGLLKTFIGFSD